MSEVKRQTSAERRGKIRLEEYAKKTQEYKKSKPYKDHQREIELWKQSSNGEIYRKWNEGAPERHEAAVKKQLSNERRTTERANNRSRPLEEGSLVIGEVKYVRPVVEGKATINTRVAKIEEFMAPYHESNREKMKTNLSIYSNARGKKYKKTMKHKKTKTHKRRKISIKRAESNDKLIK